jgi:hypothetical protein
MVTTAKSPAEALDRWMRRWVARQEEQPLADRRVAATRLALWVFDRWMRTLARRTRTQ